MLDLDQTDTSMVLQECSINQELEKIGSCLKVRVGLYFLFYEEILNYLQVNLNEDL